jgi:hypothetical protein
VQGWRSRADLQSPGVRSGAGSDLSTAQEGFSVRQETRGIPRLRISPGWILVPGNDLRPDSLSLSWKAQAANPVLLKAPAMNLIIPSADCHMSRLRRIGPFSYSQPSPFPKNNYLKGVNSTSEGWQSMIAKCLADTLNDSN